MDGAGSGGELVSSEKVLAWRQAGGGGEAAEGVVSGRWPRAREFCCGGEMDFWSGTRHSELGPQNSKQATVGPKQTVNMRAERMAIQVRVLGYLWIFDLMGAGVSAILYREFTHI
jgi:hypothetical protein